MMDTNDVSQLTEFPRFETESNQRGVTTFFNKLWKLPLFSPNESIDQSDEKLMGDERNNDRNDERKKAEISDKNDNGYSETSEFRSNTRKISYLGSGSGTRYADTELARYWMPDDISRECYDCAARFGTLRRRHHCRVCGQIFCSRCCSQRVPGQIFGCAGDLRVCTYCCNVVLRYLRENDITGEISPDLRTLQENLQIKFPENKSTSPHSRDFVFAREQETCEFKSTTKDIYDIYRQMSFALPTQQHRYRLVRYNNVWRGCDMLQWVMDNTAYKTRAQASQVCHSLIQLGYAERATEPAQFADYALYRPLTVARTETNETPEEEQPVEEPTKLVESVSSYCLDLNLGNSSARLIKSTKTEPTEVKPTEDEQQNVDNNEVEDSPRIHYMGNDIDVRNYVQIKKVPGGDMKDSVVIPGVVMTKNVVHRGMPRQISNPTVLLLDCSIAYQRVEGKLTSLEPVLMQEQEYLARCAARISALRPRVVLVRGAVARAVQDRLRELGVALALGVGDKALRRAARCAKADLVASIDARIGMPRLGTCKNFYVKNYSSKTLMVLEGCAEPNLGCSILLRGANNQELMRVKKVVKFMLLACYNWKLEKAFLGDIEAVLPEPGMSFVDDEDDQNDDKDKASKEELVETGEAVLERINTNGSDDSDDIFDNARSNALIDNSEAEDAAKDNDSVNTVDVKENDDPLKAKQFVRKTENDKNLSCGVPIRDFSDPLRSTLSMEDEVFLPEEAELKADEKSERWCTDDVVLSMSPNIVVAAPSRPLRAAPRPHTPRPQRARAAAPAPAPATEPHPFIKQAITAPADDLAMRRSLAHFRATGCRYVADKHKMECPKYNPSVIKQVQSEKETNKQTESVEPPDPLDPENHQKLSLLLYSYSNKSPNVPDFCVNPWIVTMEMYGRHDISLGAFLEKYCFSPDHKCPSSTCHVPMNQHVRKFVHDDVCITITCNTIGHSNVDKPKDDLNKQVVFWSRCEVCAAVSRGAALSRSARALSLAQYLRMRVAAPRLARALCHHPLSAHSHAFVTRLTTACFRYNKISMYEIQLPPDVISIDYDVKQMRESLIAHLNDLMLKGELICGGMIISSGVVPVVVKAGEIGSVIAATLASVTYQHTLQQHRQRHSTQSEQEEHENLASSRDRTDGDKAKAKSNNDHIEVLLKDGLVCRVYYAAQFHKLRHMLVAPLGAADERCCDPHHERDNKGVCEIEEGFIRSLAQCVPWATRGGKSGSTFCKTKDDRYVLKEMTKPEWQQFLEFAPHYFNYITNCRNNKQPSLLARILGVFSVGGAGSGVLVTEHVWYGRGACARFDLKGAARHRLALGAAAAPPGQAVLVDDNLLAIRWDRQLYVSASTANTLWSSLERDTAFLSQHHVMDYSLLLGIQDNTLVLGIIDYIRTFTWDKKLEHLVKKNLGSGQPTVVSPEQYRRRFCAAARKYFLHCPHHWDLIFGN
ncbi:putative 1-phosphatidylinositol 3-phosphate 5-kinase [Zerene cesonia]|uniref:putative 1-phosphatidylinositol 3-phosphate 5-kinase n=1 Tax=Zerene cesonia TaxID=33412 RepID=UPI0018E5796B|nr:putative 1-phosphatidylinositol 3-phosphate 5-kinase [Zerene cesonia]